MCMLTLRSKLGLLFRLQPILCPYLNSFDLFNENKFS